MIDFGRSSTREAWQIAWSCLQSCGQTDGLAALLPKGRRDLPRSLQTELLGRRARMALPQLVAATRELDIAASLAAAIPLLGAGPGLTPSWDDLLVGYLCGLRASVAVSSQARFLHELGEAIFDASAVTTAVSRGYIERTVGGCGPAWIEAVVAAIATGDAERTTRSSARALRMGHTSGTDMLLGAVLGSCAWQRGRQAADVLTALSCREPGVLRARQLN